MLFLTRWTVAFLLLSATYNPTPYNYVRWSLEHGERNVSIAVLAGLLLAVGYIIYLRATLRSIGAFGMALVLGVVVAALWVASDLGLLSLENPTWNTWIALLALATVLGTGLSWSHIRRRLSGQTDVDDVDA